MMKRIKDCISKLYLAEAPYIHVLLHYAIPVVLLSIVVGSFLDKYIQIHPYFSLGLFCAAVLSSIGALIACMWRSHLADKTKQTNAQVPPKP